MSKINLKKVIKYIAIGFTACFAITSIIAKLKKNNTTYKNEPSQKNPLEGKQVVFVYNENEPENADGVRGHLEAIGDSDYKPGFYEKYVKRGIDILLSFGGLVVLSPFLLGISVAIIIDDPGPVLFTQKRLGKNKEYFKLHKFRSMKMCTPHDVPTHMLDNPEQYITKVGKFLRAHSLDELPQIWDIFMGNMSVIGPRPGLWNQDLLTSERDKYQANDVRPGLTGWAQINGRDELEIPDKAKLDGYYVAHMGLWMDIKVFLGSLHVFGKDDSVVEGGTGEMKKGSAKEKIGRHYTDGKSAQELIGHIGFGDPVEVDTDGKKKVLITGAGSYIGESFIAYAKEKFPALEVEELDMLDDSWREKDFSGYDIVYHVAGIAHADVGNVDDETKEKYYAINTDLTVEVCKKAKMDGVKEFIFMSSMIVYGDSAPYGKKKVIDANTVPAPANFYGDSKLQADVAVRALADDQFKVIVLRPPMIYGKGSKGNYPILAKLAKKLPIFPDVNNERSMLYIENLCEFLCQIMLVKEIKENAIVLIPQNGEWTRTSEMVKMIAEVSGKKIKLLKLLKPAVWIGGKVPGKIGGLVNKAFGNSCYESQMSNYSGVKYIKTNLKESLLKTEEIQIEKKALMLASVASMIDLFNEDNINVLLELGYKVDVACNFKEGSITSNDHVEKYRRSLEKRGIGTYHVPIPRSIYRVRKIIQSYLFVKEMVNNKEYNIVHCHSPIGGVICRLACIGARRRGTKVIYTAHGFHFFKGASKKAWLIYYPVERICARYTDVLITINKEDYARAQKFKAGKVVYVPGIGVHVADIQNIVIDRNEKRKEFGLSDKDFVFMSTGQLSERKNHEVVIYALSRIHDETVKYLIVGLGELEGYLKKLAAKLNVSNRVIFAGYREDVYEILHAVDGFVFPSLQEGLPVALMEAMCVGLPVICSSVRGNIDLVENDKGGLVYDCNDIDGISNGMKYIASGALSYMGEINKEKVMQFDYSRVQNKMRKLYSNL